MRRCFFDALHLRMSQDDRIVFLTGDLGFNFIEQIRDSYPDRFFNMQAAEFSGVGAAAGLALSGKIPLYYSITPFVIFRPFELLRTYINHEKIPVKLIGVGRDRDYASEGISHWAHDVKLYVDLLSNIHQFWPASEKDLLDAMDSFLYDSVPAFLSLKK